jgi:hypothetical protein
MNVKAEAKIQRRRTDKGSIINRNIYIYIYQWETKGEAKDLERNNEKEAQLTLGT